MFYVITKTLNANNERTLLAQFENREAAREFARGNEGSVKNDAEFAQLTTDLKIAPIASPTIEQEPTMTHETSPAADKTDDVVTNVTAPEEHPKAADSIMGAAEQVANEQSKRTTIGKKAKEEPKRVKTSDDVMARARAHATELAKQVRTAQMGKVDFPRQLALWEGKVLTRGDVIQLVEEQRLGISPATVSSQYQFARSDKWAAHQERAAKRLADIDARTGKKVDDAEAKEQAKADREAKQKAAREEKEKAKAEAKVKAQADREAKAKEREEAKVKLEQDRQQAARDRQAAKEKLDAERAAAKEALDKERAEAKAKVDAERAAAKANTATVE
jgi:hypothetical protein